jgi:hypothetical protein
MRELTMPFPTTLPQVTIFTKPVHTHRWLDDKVNYQQEIGELMSSRALYSTFKEIRGKLKKATTVQPQELVLQQCCVRHVNGEDVFAQITIPCPPPTSQSAKNTSFLAVANLPVIISGDYHGI